MILAATGLAFAPTLWASFHLDDYSVLGDPMLTSPSGAWEVWQPLRVRPLSYFTLWLNYQISGPAPFTYHLMNWHLHLVSVWLCARTLARLLPAPAALLATVVFALHPIQTESVAYVFARSTLLCGLFCWAALDAWTARRPWLAVVMQALALLAKEEAVALPLVIALLEWWRWRSTALWKPLAAMVAVTLVAGVRSVIVAASLAGSGVLAQSGVNPIAYLATQSYVLLRYAAQIVAPVALNFDPDIPLLNDWRGWTLWLIWIAVGALAVKRFSREGVWILASLAFLAPTSTLLPIQDLSADRRLYLALAAVAAAAATWKPNLPRAVTLGLGAVLLALSFSRSLTWLTEETLWRDTVAKSPAKVRSRVQLARAVTPQEALTVLGNLQDPLAVSEKGRVLMELGRPADALQAFGQVLAATPGDAGALTNRGAALAALGQTEAAQGDFRSALQSDACFFPALRNLKQLGSAMPANPACRFSAEQRLALQGRIP